MAHDGRVREPRRSYNLATLTTPELCGNQVVQCVLRCVTWFSSNRTKYVGKSKALEKDAHVLYLVCAIMRSSLE